MKYTSWNLRLWACDAAMTSAKVKRHRRVPVSVMLRQSADLRWGTQPGTASSTIVFLCVIFISCYLWIPTAFPCGICGLRCAERSHVFINIMRTIRVDGWYQRISPVSGISFSWFSIRFTGLYTHITSVTSFCPIKLIIPYWNSFLSKRIL